LISILGKKFSPNSECREETAVLPQDTFQFLMMMIKANVIYD